MEKSIAVLLSGSGRTLENILNTIDDINVEVVISSKNNVRGLEIAKKYNIESYVVKRNEYNSTREFSSQIDNILEGYQFSLIIMAGFLNLYDYPDKYNNKIMNIHPALIPAFCGKGYYGMKVHRAVHNKGVKITGCTVHFVDKKYDNGPIIIQKAVSIKADDTPEDIAKKVFNKECEAYPEAIRLFFNNQLMISGNKVYIKN